jgi:hypothetical protein
MPIFAMSFPRLWVCAMTDSVKRVLAFTAIDKIVHSVIGLIAVKVPRFQGFWPRPEECIRYESMHWPRIGLAVNSQHRHKIAAMGEQCTYSLANRIGRAVRSDDGSSDSTYAALAGYLIGVGELSHGHPYFGHYMTVAS